MHLPAILWTLLAQLVVAVASAVITVRLALRRYRQEKWWEKKYEAYVAILIALHRMKKSFSDDYELAITRREPSDEQKGRSLKLYNEATDEIARLSDLADFLFSETPCSIIKEFGQDIKASSDEPTYEGFLDLSAYVSGIALTALKVSAKQDLQVHRPRLNHMPNGIRWPFQVQPPAAP